MGGGSEYKGKHRQLFGMLELFCILSAMVIRIYVKPHCKEGVLQYVKIGYFFLKRN